MRPVVDGPRQQVSGEQRDVRGTPDERAGADAVLSAVEDEVSANGMRMSSSCRSVETVTVAGLGAVVECHAHIRSEARVTVAS
ncbi:hypothetical protein ABZX40_34760 [Streptomyces sp. NPDC004610]|uniref:hypothetical protein n=1 Tax=Streptomyces sp. NPDC004610 TaxID=3154668 RepID=UPI0033ACA86D